MKVSIVVPVYNLPPPLLTECLAAVGRQTLRPDDYEILIVDDGSTDAHMGDIVEQFSAPRDNCRVIRHETNRGPNQARLTGVRHARGEFVLFVDGDDILSRDAAELLYLESVRANADVVTAPLYRWNAETRSYDVSPVHDKPYPQALPARMKAALNGTHSFTMCGRLFRRTLLREAIFDMPDALLHEDLVTTIRVLFNAYRVAAIAEPVYYYTINEASRSSVFTPGYIDGLFYAVTDWIRQATERSMADELERPIQRGAERLINTFVLRFARSTDLTLEEKLARLDEIDRNYDSLPIARPEATLPGTKILEAIASHGAPEPGRVRRLLDELVPPERWTSSSKYARTLGPSETARKLKGKVVIIGQADHHVRNAARLARAVRQRGYPCVVMDNTAVADKGRRQLNPGDKALFWRTEHIKVRDRKYGPDWLSTASVVVAFNDFNPVFREALEYRHRLGLPTVCMIEGINDFLRVDFDTPRVLPYRRCDYVLLAGEDDEQYFEDRPTFVVGMPAVEALAATEPEFPQALHAVLNVNFTYGVLEGKRNEFVRAAQEAFDELGISWEITQHPMDNGDLTGMPVSASTQQELIDGGSVFVSRFATGIIEALASGKPAIYFNPHHEQVAKFAEPLGAYEIATSAAELVEALRRVEADIAAGVDFRARAAAFLQRHAAYARPEGGDAGTRFATAVKAILDAHEEKLSEAWMLFLDRFEELEPFRRERSGLVLGEFARAHSAQFNEEEMIGRCFGPGEGLMFDVGANFGNSADVYLGKGWTVHAFEPDPANRAQLEQLWPDCERLVINPEAVSDTDGVVVPLFASDESTGISSLSAFTEGHHQVAEVSTVTLATYMHSAAVEHVDFLKVDVEGFDKFVLDGFPWEKDRPDAVLVEFEDRKTVPLGYDIGDLAELLRRHGYTIYVSEWHPVVRYGIAHDWKSLSRYDPEVDLSDTWGNLVGFLADPDEEVLARATIESLRFVVRPSQPKATERPKRGKAGRAAATGGGKRAQPVPTHQEHYSPAALPQHPTSRMRLMFRRWRRAWTGRANRPRRRLYQEFANGVREGMPTVFRMAQVGAWELRAARRHWVATGTLAAAIAVAVLLPIGADEPGWRPWSWSIAAALIVVAGALAVGAAAREALRQVVRRNDRVIAESQRKLQRRFERDMRRVDRAVAAGARRQSEELTEQTRLMRRAVARSTKQVRTMLEQTLASEAERQAGQLSLLRGTIESIGGSSAEAAARSSEQILAMQESAATQRRFSNYSNIAGFTAHDRYFSAEDAAHTLSYWAPRFGLTMSTRQLMYLAHDICRTEDWCEGRLATTVHAAVVRSLALASLGTGEVDVLEIGTLFGIGAGALYRTGARAGQRVRLTLVDPLDGYYNVGLRDVTTGVPVTFDILSRNLKAMAVADSDVRVIVGKSGDDEVLAEVSDRRYDYLLIDGDHTLGGVAADFTRYEGLVRPGGLLIFDDYDTTDWPQIKSFVDGHVRGHGEWQCVGTGWRTAVFTRVGAESTVGSGPAPTVAHSSPVADGA